WPLNGPTADQLHAIHTLMNKARERGLGFVPAVCRTRDGRSCAKAAGRLWDLTQWLPGRADFRALPTPARPETACPALAQLHAAWEENRAHGPCPAVARRLNCAREWTDLLGSGWRPDFGVTRADPVRDWAERAWRLLPRHLPGLAETLE